MSLGRLARRLPLLPLLAALLVVPDASAAVPDASGKADLAITHVHVVDVEEGRILTDQTVTIDDGVIRTVLPAAGDAPVAELVVDGGGGYLIPGLWDMHAHLRSAGLPGWITTDWLMPLLVAHGVTGVRDMASDCDGPEQGPVCLDQMRAWQAEIEAGELLGPRLVALSSFMVNPPWDYDVTEEQIVGLVEHMASQEVDLIKIYDRLAPDAFAWLAEEASERGIPMAGHVPLRVGVIAAVEAGFRSIEHARDVLFDCYPGTTSFRATAKSSMPSTDEMRAMVDQHDPARCRELFRTMVEHDTWYVPTHVTRRMEAFADDPNFRNDPRTRYLPPPMLGAWNADADRTVERDPSPEGRRAMRDFYDKGLALTGAAHRAGVQVLAGTDGGDTYVFPGSGLHDELEELVSAGLTPAEALRAATSKPTEFLGREADYGTVEAGKKADLVLLEGDPLADIRHVRTIRAVVFRGELLDRSRLDELLEQAQKAAHRPLGPDPDGE